MPIRWEVMPILFFFFFVYSLALTKIFISTNSLPSDGFIHVEIIIRFFLYLDTFKNVEPIWANMEYPCREDFSNVLEKENSIEIMQGWCLLFSTNPRRGTT